MKIIDQERYKQVSKIRMNTKRQNPRWHRIVDKKYDDFDGFAAQVHGWDLDFRQLKAGKSPAELLQFGRADFHVTSFYMEQPYEQRGCTLPNAITVGLIEEGVEAVTTANGKLQQDGIIYFPAGSEFSCVSDSQFKGYTLTIADDLVDEVAESAGLQRAKSGQNMNMVVQHCRRGNINVVRQQLRHITRGIEKINNTPDAPNVIRDLEFELIRELVLGTADLPAVTKPLLTPRKKMVLQRALDYIEANSHKAITVVELSQASGASVRMLEYVFRDYYNVTPKSYLRSHRLTGAHRELRHSLPAKPVISEIAAHWGFWHMGQFAADYQCFFGELPSETLKI